jgi:hypothetical protein
MRDRLGRRMERKTECDSTDEIAPEVLSILARRLHDEMDRLDPGVEKNEWDTLSEREHEFYRLAVLSVLREALAHKLFCGHANLGKKAGDFEVTKEMIETGINVFYSYCPDSDGGWMDGEMIKKVLEAALKKAPAPIIDPSVDEPPLHGSLYRPL